MKAFLVGLIAATVAAFTFGHASAASAAVCGGRYHQVTVGPDGGALILKEHDISCRTVINLGRALLTGRGPTPHHATHVDHFLCRYVPINAGGGAARCTSGRSMVLFGFE